MIYVSHCTVIVQSQTLNRKQFSHSSAKQLNARQFQHPGTSIRTLGPTEEESRS